VSNLERWFGEVYDATYTDLVRFASRRGHAHQAEDVAAEAVTVAWRRAADLPANIDEARAWLFGIARRLLLAQVRLDARQALPVRIGDPDERLSGQPGHEDAVVAAVDLAAAWRRLTSVHQEALSLTVWDGLTGSQAAAVLGISPVAYRIRLSRARNALQALMDVAPPVTVKAAPCVTEGGRP
jgi:RNA polymerase sigma-70 factor (ECF subfamily)